jgi:hypothetical protein
VGVNGEWTGGTDGRGSQDQRKFNNYCGLGPADRALPEEKSTTASKSGVRFSQFPKQDFELFVLYRTGFGLQ